MEGKTLMISDLKYKDILYLAEILDDNLSYKNWNSFGKLLIKEGLDISPYQIDFLKHGYTEEESASWTFIQSLSAKLKSCNIDAFRNIARLYKRNDICNFLDTLHDQSIDIWKLSTKEKRKLVYYLELSSIKDNDWRIFADELGYSYTDITVIRCKKRNMEKPTVLLFNLLLSKFPTLSLTKLRDISMKEPDYYPNVIARLNSICN